jgi:hypothetical protein
VEDKRWYVCCGKRDSGKGLITALLKYAFGKYIGEFYGNASLQSTIQIMIVLKD